MSKSIDEVYTNFRRSPMKGLMLLANGFEDNEALTVRDVLLRAGIEITTASIDEEISVISSHKLKVFADELLKNLDLDNFTFLILPGGGKGTANLKMSSLVSKTVLDFATKNKLICAICAAPGVLGRLGLLKGKNYTCFPNCEDGEGNNTNKEVEIDSNFITARSMFYSIDFALAIIEKLLGKEKKEEIIKQIKGL